MDVKLLVSPLAKGAYFADYLDVARAEFLAAHPEAAVTIEQRGNLDFLNVTVGDSELKRLARLSFVQGIFQPRDGYLEVLEVDPEYSLPEQLVYGAKYQGKTNELITQLAINIGLLYATPAAGESVFTVLDPMAGRGTTLLWALRYAMNARGIEQDKSAPAGLHQHLKKQTKLLRLKHRQSDGFVGKRNKQGRGKFVQFDMAERTLRLVSGDSRDAPELLANQRFDLLVTDLPYGIQHTGRSGARNPLQTVEDCADAWIQCLRSGAAIVLIFNTYQPKRDELISVFTNRGCTLREFTAPHRMSESIVRDVVAFTRG